MGGFDKLAMADRYFGNGDIAALNSKLHESTAYNVFQTGVTAVAIFTGGMTTTMKCFVAGTMILTAEGLVAIENIKAGDMVIATDPETGLTAPKVVLETYIRKTSHLVHLTVCGETIVSTFDHPYFVKDKGFVNACDLWIGAELVDNNGSIHLVEQIYREELGNYSVVVYNFQVDNYHTYHVSNIGIIVNNAGRNYSSETKQYVQDRQEQGHQFEKQMHEKLKSKNPTAEDQVRVKPMDEFGNAKRAGGNYLDDLFINKDGKMEIIEYKLGKDSPYQTNQKLNGFPEGRTNNDLKITSGKYKETVIPKGTKVTTIRKEY